MKMIIKMEMNIGEVLDLAAWLEKHGLKRTHRVVIEQECGNGIGTATQARVKTTESEGIFIDITDYDVW
jgi:hypothetical protein